jgi:hypothetical protein
MSFEAVSEVTIILISVEIQNSRLLKYQKQTFIKLYIVTAIYMYIILYKIRMFDVKEVKK